MKLLPACLAFLLLANLGFSETVISLPETTGQFVRIELSGKKRPLRLAEVEVYSAGNNVALLTKQRSIHDKPRSRAACWQRS